MCVCACVCVCACALQRDGMGISLILYRYEMYFGLPVGVLLFSIHSVVSVYAMLPHLRIFFQGRIGVLSLFPWAKQCAKPRTSKVGCILLILQVQSLMFVIHIFKKLTFLTWILCFMTLVLFSVAKLRSLSVLRCVRHCAWTYIHNLTSCFDSAPSEWLKWVSFFCLMWFTLNIALMFQI